MFRGSAYIESIAFLNFFVWQTGKPISSRSETRWTTPPTLTVLPMYALRPQSTVTMGPPGPGLPDSPNSRPTISPSKPWMALSPTCKSTSCSVPLTPPQAREPLEKRVASAWATKSSCSSTTTTKIKSSSSQGTRVEQPSLPATHAL